MKRSFFILLFSAVSFFSFAQPVLDSLIDEGVDLHDRGYLEEAVKKYDSALAKDPRNYRANYEKAYTFSELKKYDECIAICKFLLEEHKGNPHNKEVWVTYGSVLDYEHKPDEAIKTYDDGLKEFPDYHLLHFNKAITLANQNKLEEAQISLQSSLRSNPFHASSHHVMAIVMQRRNKIAALLSCIAFLSLEPEGERAVLNMQRIESILGANVTKKDEKNIEITMPSDLFDNNASSENNFRTVEVFMSLSSALDHSDQYKNETTSERLNRKLSGIVGSLKEGRKDGKGFFWEFYVPFVVGIDSNKMTNTLAHVIYTSSDEPDNNKWLKDHKIEVTEFFDWVRQYKWINK